MGSGKWRLANHKKQKEQLDNTKDFLDAANDIKCCLVTVPISMNEKIAVIAASGIVSDGDSVFVPIIPKMKTLDLILNDVNAVINIADIANQVQSKLSSSRTDSTTFYATGGAIESINVGVTNTAVAIATHTGKMNTVVAATVSGEAEFTINSDYTGSYEQTYDMCQATMAAYGASNGYVQHGYPTDGLIMAALVAGQSALDSQLAGHKAALESAIIAQYPLTVTVFKNGVYQYTFEIFDNLNPQFIAASSLGLVSVQNAKVVYDTTSDSKPITIDVTAGDYVEFVVHAGLVVSGISSPIDLDNAKIAGFASGTVNLHYGTVTASMG